MKEYSYQLIIENGRTYYLCSCGVKSVIEETTKSGYCHKRSTGNHKNELSSSYLKAKEAKMRVKGTSLMSVKKFNGYAKT